MRVNSSCLLEIPNETHFYLLYFMHLEKENLKRYQIRPQDCWPPTKTSVYVALFVVLGFVSRSFTSWRTHSDGDVTLERDNAPLKKWGNPLMDTGEMNSTVCFWRKKKIVDNADNVINVNGSSCIRHDLQNSMSSSRQIILTWFSIVLLWNRCHNRLLLESSWPFLNVCRRQETGIH